jgi:hypothetical protein
MVPLTLENMIKAQLKTLPVGQAPKQSTVVSTPQSDGTVKTSVVTVPGPVFLDDGTIDAISKAVSVAVVSFLKANAVATGANVGGPVISVLS